MFIDIKEIPCENFSEAEASVITKKQRSYIQKFVQKFFMSPVIVKAQKNRQNFAKRPSSRRYTARWVSLYIRLFLNHVGGGSNLYSSPYRIALFLSMQMCEFCV